MIIIHAVFNINPAKQDAFLEEIQPLIAASRAESGNVSYNLHKATEKDNEFTMVEVWHLAVTSHNSSEHFTSFVGKAKEFLSSPLIVNAFEGQPLK
jgi:quinol monooxygenase YgiN